MWYFTLTRERLQQGFLNMLQMKVYICCKMLENCKRIHKSSFKKEPPTQVFSCEHCEISKNTYFKKHLRATVLSLTDLGDRWIRNILKSDSHLPKEVCVICTVWNVSKYGPEKLRIWTLFTQCCLIDASFHDEKFFLFRPQDI